MGCVESGLGLGHKAPLLLVPKKYTRLGLGWFSVACCLALPCCEGAALMCTAGTAPQPETKHKLKVAGGANAVWQTVVYGLHWCVDAPYRAALAW